MKIHAMTILCALLTATSAKADFSRAVSTNDLTCVGTRAGEENITVTVKASAAEKVTKIEVRGGLNRDILNNQVLEVQTEGNVYMQQVSNELQYNLFLAGEGLEAALQGVSPVKVRLTGSLYVFHKNPAYELKCEGTLY